MTIQYTTAKVSECFDEVLTLLDAHYQELSVTKHYKLNPCFDLYKANESNGKCRVILCKDNNVIVGYIVFFIDINLHYQDCLLATEDIYYLKPEYRKGRTGIKMFKFAEEYLKSLGVNMIKYATKVHSDNSALFEYLGYAFTEKVYIKTIKE
jgi:hypothetical protein